jgi:hypothetical protein
MSDQIEITAGRKVSAALGPAAAEGERFEIGVTEDQACQARIMREGHRSSALLQVVGARMLVYAIISNTIVSAEQLCAAGSFFALTGRGKYIGCASQLTRPARH